MDGDACGLPESNVHFRIEAILSTRGVARQIAPALSAEPSDFTFCVGRDTKEELRNAGGRTATVRLTSPKKKMEMIVEDRDTPLEFSH